MKLQLLLFSVCWIFNLNAQVNNGKVHRVKDNSACLYGYKNDSNQWVIPPSFTSTYDFIKGYTIVNNNVGYGVVDEYGKVTVPLVYDNLTFINCYYCSKSPWGESSDVIAGLFIATRKHKKGLINAKNEVVLPIEYLKVEELVYGYGIIMTSDSLYGFTDKNGGLIEPEYSKVSNFEDYKVAIVSKNKQYGLIDSLGNLIVPIAYDEIKSFEHHNTTTIKKGLLFGLINKKGIVLDPEFDYIENTYDENLFVKKNGVYGVINSKGKYIIEPKYSNLEYLNYNNALWCTENGLIGVIDKSNGKIICRNMIQSYYPWFSSKNKSFIIKINDRYGIMDINGIIILEPQYDDYSIAVQNDAYNFRNSYSGVNKDYFVFLKDGKAVGYNPKRLKEVPLYEAMNFDGQLGKISSYKKLAKSKSNNTSIYRDGIINPSGRIILEPNYLITKFPGIIVYKDSNNRFGVINWRGDIIATPGRFNKIDKVTNGIVIVIGYNGKCGLIDNQGNLIIDTVFYKVLSYAYIGTKGYAWVLPEKPESKSKTNKDDFDWCNGKYGMVDSGVHFVLPPIYDFPVKFVNDRAVISANHKYGIIRSDGKTILPFDYDNILSQPNGLFILHKADKFGLANVDGKILLKPEYNYIWPFQSRCAIIDKDYKTGLINSKGEFIIKPSSYAIDSAKTELTKYIDFLYQAPEVKLDPVRYIKNYKIEQVISPQKHMVIDLIVDSKNEDVQRLCNNQILLWASSSDDILAGWVYNSGCDRSLYDHPEFENYYQKSHRSERKSYTYFKILDITDFSFCIDKQNKDQQYSSVDHGIDNYIFFNNRFSFAYLDSLFDPKTDYLKTLNNLIIEEIKKHDDLELDCTNPNKYFESLRGNYSFSENGFCLYFENRKTDNKLYEIIIPYAKLKTVAAKKGLIMYLIEKSDAQK